MSTRTTRRNVKDMIGHIMSSRDSRSLKRALSKFNRFGLFGSWNLDRFYIGLAMVHDMKISGKTRAQVLLDWANYISTDNLPVSVNTVDRYFRIAEFFYNENINLQNRIFDYIDIPFEQFYSLILFADKYVNDENHRPTVFVDRVIREMKRLQKSVNAHSCLILLRAIENILNMRAYSDINVAYRDIKSIFSGLFSALKRSMFAGDATLISRPDYFLLKPSQSHRDLVIDRRFVNQGSYIDRILQEIKQQLNSRARDTKVMYYKHNHDVAKPKRIVRIVNGDKLSDLINSNIVNEKFSDINKGMVVIEVSEIRE